MVWLVAGGWEAMASHAERQAYRWWYLLGCIIQRKSDYVLLEPETHMHTFKIDSRRCSGTFPKNKIRETKRSRKNAWLELSNMFECFTTFGTFV